MFSKEKVFAIMKPVAMLILTVNSLPGHIAAQAAAVRLPGMSLDNRQVLHTPLYPRCSTTSARRISYIA
jgi:hypothetical protein